MQIFGCFLKIVKDKRKEFIQLVKKNYRSPYYEIKNIFVMCRRKPEKLS